MLQKYEEQYPQSTSQSFSLIDITDQIIRIKHHESMIDNRHQRIFIKYFHFDPSSLDYHHRWAQDILLFASQKQCMNKLYQMQTIIRSIRQCILNRIKVDHIAPFLAPGLGQDNIISEIKKWNKALIQLPETRTMNTESSKIRKKYKNIIYDTLLISNKNNYQIQHVSHDCSNDTLNKITQDLSRMLKDICIHDQNRKKIKIKYKSEGIHSTSTLQKKHIKKKLSTHKIYSIQSNQPQKNTNYLIYQYYPQQQHIKKQNKTIIKISQLKIKNKPKSINSLDSKSITKRKINKNTDYPLSQKTSFTPLTPKPRNHSKIQQLEQQSKSPRYSYKAHQKNIGNKSPTIRTKIKQLKSVIEHKTNQLKSNIELKTNQLKKQKIGKGK